MESGNKYSINVKIDIFLFNVMLVALEVMGIKRAFKYSYSTLRFYTTDSNILLCVTSVVMAITALVCIINKCDIPKSVLIFKYFSVCCITMTFVIVLAVLLPGKVSKGYGMHIMYKGAQIYHHTLCPFIAIITYIFVEKKDKFDKIFIKLAYVPTIIYGIVIVYLNLKGRVLGPYPFLKVTKQPVYESVKWGIIIFLVASVINTVMYLARHPMKNPEKIKEYTYRALVFSYGKIKAFYEE